MKRPLQYWRAVALAVLMAGPAQGLAVGEDEILVTATRTAKRPLDIPASVEVMDRAALESANAAEVGDLFRTMVGADLQGSGSPGAGIKLGMRGLTTGYQTKRVLVLVDGRRLNEQYQGNAELALLPTDGIERIEVLRGPASALYGSSAMGGVINIISRTATAQPHTRFAASGGSDNTFRYLAAHGWRTGALDYFVAGSHVESDGHINNSDGTDRDWVADNATGNVGWQLGEASELRLYLGAYRGEGTEESSERKTRKDHQMLVYRRDEPDVQGGGLLVRASRGAERHEYAWKYGGSGIYEQDTLAAELQQSAWLGEMNLATFGVEARQEGVDIEENAGAIDQSTALVAGYVQDEIHLSEAWQVTLGLRFDHNEDFADEWSPHLGVLWRVNESVEAFASANLAHRAPGLSDRYVSIEYNSMRFEGNPDLDPETLTAYEIGGRSRFGGGRFSAEAALFYNDMQDSFDFLMGSDGVFYNENVTRSQTYGVEARLNGEVTETLLVFVNYSHTEGEYDEFPAQPGVEGNDLAYLAKDKASVGLRYRAESGQTHSLSGRFVGKRYADAQNTADDRMDSAVVFDWRSRLPVTETIQLTLNVDNVTDESYREFPTFEQPGRTFMAGLEMTF